jgi:flagellar hook-length control protein FliK
VFRLEKKLASQRVKALNVSVSAESLAWATDGQEQSASEEQSRGR